MGSEADSMIVIRLSYDNERRCVATYYRLWIYNNGTYGMSDFDPTVNVRIVLRLAGGHKGFRVIR